MIIKLQRLHFIYTPAGHNNDFFGVSGSIRNSVFWNLVIHQFINTLQPIICIAQIPPTFKPPIWKI